MLRVLEPLSRGRQFVPSVQLLPLSLKVRSRAGPMSLAFSNQILSGRKHGSSVAVLNVPEPQLGSINFCVSGLLQRLLVGGG